MVPTTKEKSRWIPKFVKAEDCIFVIVLFTKATLKMGKDTEWVWK